MRRLFAVLGLVLAVAAPVQAHEGPPFPIIVDEKSGPYSISVWTDPDVGIGTFFVILDPAPGETIGDDLKVQVCVQPTSGRLEEACHPATRQRMRSRVQYYAEVPFDAQEIWRVRVTVSGPAGDAEVLGEVEATPPGYGAWDLAIYVFPFLLVAVLWAVGMIRQRTRREPRGQSATALQTLPTAADPR